MLTFLFALLLRNAVACSNFLVTKSASSNNSTMISYNADSENLFGCLYHTPAGKWSNDTKIDIYDWDSTKYLGTIPQASVTYNVIGNMNEYQLAITETTFGGLEELSSQPAAIVDYGSLIYLALARSQTAREAIQVMSELTSTYGYYSEGESFSLADPKEVWILEMIGKGNYELGSVWVAMRIPDGYISGHANQARIRTFPQNDSNNCLYSSDVISFARKRGYYNGSDADFSFSDVYDPVTFEGARFCEARVWSMFNKYNSDMAKYLDYAQGYNLTNRMPLYVKADKTVSLIQHQNTMGDHYENTWFDFSSDVGAGAFNLPYRWRPLTWQTSLDPSSTYLNERSMGTEQTGFTLVAQIRDWLPREVGGILWFSPDDASSAIYVPMYSSMTQVPSAYVCDWPGSGPNGNWFNFDMNKGFVIFNMVANWGYSRYSDIKPEITSKQQYYQNLFASQIPTIDQQAMNVYNSSQNSTDAILALTNYSVQSAAAVIKDWQSFFGYLFIKYSDGYIKTPDSTSWNPSVASPGYSDPWLERIVKDTGNHYLEPTATVSKQGLRKLKMTKL